MPGSRHTRHRTRRTAGRSSAPTGRPVSSIRISARRLALIGLVVVGFGWIGCQIIVDTAGKNATEPETVLAWTPEDAGALDELAYREVAKTDGNLDIARTLAQRALRSNPLDARALFVLGLIAERLADRSRAESLMRLAGARTWRDPNTQGWLLKRDIQRGDFGQSLSHLDALLRTNEDLVDQTVPLLAAFTIDQRTFDAIASFLDTAPPWRTSALERLSNRLSDVGRLTELFTALKNGRHPPSVAELAPYLGRLVRDGRFGEAHQTWRETLPPPQRNAELTLYNGDFAAPIDGLPFNWLLRPVRGMDVQIVGLPDTASRALQFQFSGARIESFTVRELVMLMPGEYRLNGSVRAEALRTTGGLAWNISCADAPQNVLARTSPAAGSLPWTGFSAVFVVPAESCRGQWLNLELQSRTASERQIEGQVWYRNLEIVRIENRNSAPNP